MTKEEALEILDWGRPREWDPEKDKNNFDIALMMATRALREKPIFDKMEKEIESLNPVDYGSVSSYESHRGARDMKDDVLRIIDKYK